MEQREVDLLKLRRAFYEAQAHGKIRLLTPLPRRVRVRLWKEHRVNSTGIWLVKHRFARAAELLWRFL